ncbi:hypothetical protein GCM10023205_04680 [Yinghuangia aomiensis]|uniref:IrrE N-terminal-like domain-containing protein n=1 Tax=Yinghuangia aomiensis TaxID=676205 RepID=A0ABP9GME0_9ACTN
MNLRGLRAGCLQRIRDLRIPAPFDIDEFCANVSSMRGRPLVLTPLPEIEHRDVPCGMWLGTTSIDYVYYAAETSKPHRDHIVVHELAHMLCGHKSSIDADFARLLLPGTNPTLIRRLMGRSGYPNSQEQEAEMMATVIMERAYRDAGAPSQHARSGLKRLDATLGLTPEDEPWR